MSLKHWLWTRINAAERVKNLAYALGYDVTALSPFDHEPHYREIYQRVRPFTMTSLSRVYAVISAIEHVSKKGIAGAFVECGVWRGGSSMAALLALKKLGDISREAWLFDTYEGMVKPGERDGQLEKDMHAQFAREDGGSDWCRAGMNDVRANLSTCDYPMERVHLVPGRVEETIPANGPQEIAVLRLDTDWYDSTKHELEHFYPRLARGGVLIIDDYGAWEGARRAVDEYFATHGIDSYLHRIDSTGRMLIKA